MNMQILSQIMLAIGAAARTPGIEHESVARWSELIAGLIQTGTAADARLLELRDHIQTMVEADRNPTEAELRTLQKRGDDAHDTIQAWRG